METNQPPEGEGEGQEPPESEFLEGKPVWKRELTPEQVEATLRLLRTRFEKNVYLHEGVKFEDVKKSLEAKPEALWSVVQMEAQGHEPDVYNFDAEGFDIGTCSKESPEKTRNCVFSKKEACDLREEFPNEVFNGSAEEMAEAMGIGIMYDDNYSSGLRGKDVFDLYGGSWLLNRKTNCGCYGFQGTINYRFPAKTRSKNVGFRGSIRVPWVV